MPAVQYDHELITLIDGVLDAAKELLEDAAERMRRQGYLDHDDASSVLDTRDNMGQWLAKYEMGYWLSPDTRERMLEYEAIATDIILDLDEAS